MRLLLGSQWQNKHLLSLLMVFASATGLSLWANHVGPAVVWLLGHILIAIMIPRMDRPERHSLAYPAFLHAGFAAAVFVVFLFLLQLTANERLGWRGFLHLRDLQMTSWGHLLALLAPAIGVWLFGLRQLQLLQNKIPDRSKRLLLLIATAAAVACADFIRGMELGYAALTLSLALFLISLDVYLENDRTSMTWLLLWWLLISLLMAVFAYRQSLRIDQLAQVAIANDIAAYGEPDTNRMYHLPFQWDTLAPPTARERLAERWLKLPPGQGEQRLDGGRTDWIFHHSEQKGFVIVGRNAGGFRSPLALTSVLFLSGLAYCLCLRFCAWCFGYPYYRWQLPLFGRFTLRVRIQLAFFVLALVAFILVGIFTIDFFRGQPQFLSRWLEQLLSLYVFLLLIAGALGIFLANSISEPIVRIGQKLGSTRLKNNEPLSWPRDDEIGRLVSNYNQMIIALDDSATKLAASERESAWREMAKQVAHEIKNPLTPMKLQLQQLLRLEKEDPERAREWRQRITKSMIEQIDGLALIATEFSHFARLPEANATTFDLRELVQSAYGLHQAGKQRDQIQLSLPDSPMMVYADRDQLLRVLNNLLRNADQALTPTENGTIRLSLTERADKLLIEVEDNGAGIPEHIQSKIFQPNFTTKSSGMGLGLAMCKNIVEQAQGKIRFRTVVDQGTCFEVELPKMNSKEEE